MLPDISRSKGNHSMKFSQLIEYNIKNIFLEKSCAKYCGETNPRAFFEETKIEHISESTV